VQVYCGVFVGGCCGARNRKTIIGGWGWAWWLVTDVQTYVIAVAMNLLFNAFVDAKVT